MTRDRLERLILIAVVAGALILSGVRPVDRLTWWLEISWVVAGLPLLIATHRRFPLTPLLYRLLALHAIVLIVGGHYTYAQVPVGLWVKEALGLARNDYDRLGHLMQGFVPAILAREILRRRTPLQPGGWLFLVVTAITLAFSAFFEMIEWWAAVLLGSGADAFLATQGDPWDTQWDMFCALIGAVVSQILLQRRHEREIGSLRVD